METTLFNKNGKPVAYLAADGETIYLWDGRAVASLVGDKIFGWNGRQLGWFDNGTVFDIYGLRAGFIKTKSPVAIDIEPHKPGKQAKSARSVRRGSVPKPALCYGYSSKPLEELLEEGGRP